MQKDKYKVGRDLPSKAAFHSALLKQALLRDQVQSAISQLVLGYEATSGASVVRLNFHTGKRTVSLEAIPRKKPA
jgi:hypothetical protein